MSLAARRANQESCAEKIVRTLRTHTGRVRKASTSPCLGSGGNYRSPAIPQSVTQVAERELPSGQVTASEDLNGADRPWTSKLMITGEKEESLM